MTSTHEADRPSLSPKLPYALGRFTLCQELGAGGMATVYLSKMRLGAGLERLVALKTIHAHLANQQTFVDMFLDEAKIASHISHPNVCAVYDFGDVGDVYFLAMEYLVGEPLFDFINRVVTKKDSPELMEALPFLAARILADACEGLHAAHTAKSSDGKKLNIVHRDVSPQNLFVTYEGAVKVVDFGCAKALERVTQTNTGIMKGKVSYAAPEQLRAESLDARADVFALGVCLWETLTLRQLFRRDTAIKTAMAVLEEEIPRADAKAKWVPKELADITEKALQRDPDQRFGSAREMGRALRGFIAKSGAPFESAELADWMRYLFEERHQKTMDMVAEVEAIEASRVASVAKIIGPGDAEPPPKDEGTASARAPRLSLEDDPTQLAKTPSSARQTTPALAVDDEPVVLPTSTKKWIALLVLLIGAGAGAYFVYGDQIRAWLDGQEPEPVAGEPVVDEPDEPDMVVEPDEVRVEEGDPGDETGETGDEAAVAGDEAMAAETMDSRGDRDRDSRRDRDRRRRRAEEDEEADDARDTQEQDFSTGSVRVVADNGWALVKHEGRDLGRTPLRTTLPVGRQRLLILPQGNGPGETVTVNVESGTLQTLRVHVESAPPPSMSSMSAMDEEVDWNNNPY